MCDKGSARDCSQAADLLPPECLETSLVCITEKLYGHDPRQMLAGVLQLMRKRYNNDRQFESALQHFLPASGQANTSFAALPEELIEHIISFVIDDATTLGIMSQVCRSWFVPPSMCWHVCLRVSVL